MSATLRLASCIRSMRANPGTSLSRTMPGDFSQMLLMPPSTSISEPVMNELSSEARKTAAAACSSGRPSLSMGT